MEVMTLETLKGQAQRGRSAAYEAAAVHKQALEEVQATREAAKALGFCEHYHAGTYGGVEVASYDKCRYVEGMYSEEYKKWRTSSAGQQFNAACSILKAAEATAKLAYQQLQRVQDRARQL